MFYVKRGLVLSQTPLSMPLCDWDEAVLRLPKAMRTMNIRDGHAGQGDLMPYLLSCDIHTHTMFSAHAVFRGAVRGNHGYVPLFSSVT